MALKNQACLIRIIDAIECMEKCLSCAICLEISSDPVETRCGHLFCRTCIRKVLSQPGESCPVCKLNLSRRSVSSSHQMGSCIQQLSKLVNAIRNDTGIDVASCLKTHYKKRAFLPSLCPPSPQSLQDVQSQIPPSKSDNNKEKEPQNVLNKSASLRAKQDDRLSSNEASSENPIRQHREQSNSNLSCKLTTTKNKIQDIQNENVLPLENTTEIRQLDNKANESPESRLDQPLDETRQCLKDIGTSNENHGIFHQSTKTWSRVAKFGKELRRKSGTRLRKKEKLCVNVRDKNAASNTPIDNLMIREKSDEDRVDHETNINILLTNRPDHDTTASHDQANKNACEKASPERCNPDDETMSKIKEQQQAIIFTNDKSSDDKIAPNDNFVGSRMNKMVANRANKMNDQLGEHREKFEDLTLKTDLGKSRNQANRTDKQLYECKEKITDLPLNADLEKTRIPANKTDKRLDESREKLEDLPSNAHLGKTRTPSNKTDKQLDDHKERHSDLPLNDDLEKSITPQNKASKQSYERKDKLEDLPLKAVLGKSPTPSSKANTQLFEEGENLSDPPDVHLEKQTSPEKIPLNSNKPIQSQSLKTHQALRPERTSYKNLPENLVHFKKLGHLFRTYKKKNVAFLFLGTLKRELEPNSDNESANICKLCSSSFRSEETSLFKKFSLQSPFQSIRAANFIESSSSLQKHVESSSNRPKLISSPKISTNQIMDSVIIDRSHQSDNFDDESSFSPANLTENTLTNHGESPESLIPTRKRKPTDQCFKKQTDKFSSHELSPNETVESCQQDYHPNAKPASQELSSRCIDGSSFSSMNVTEETLINHGESPKSLIPTRKRKRTETCDDGNDRRFKKKSDKFTSHELSFNENDESYRQDYQSNAKPASQELPARCNNTTNAIEAWERENVSSDFVEIDFMTGKALREVNATMGNDFLRTSLQSPIIRTSDQPEIVSCAKNDVLVGPKDFRQSSGHESVRIALNAELSGINGASESYRTLDSMMDITGEEMLFKKFEENLFGRKKRESEGKGNEVASEGREESDRGSTVVVNSTLLDSNRCDDDQDFVELTPAERISSRSNRPTEIRHQNKNAVTTIQRNVKIPQNPEKGKSAATLLSNTNQEGEVAKKQAQTNSKMRPLYQSTPKSSQAMIDRRSPSVHNQKTQKAILTAPSLEHERIPESPTVDSPRLKRGCIVCSGLTARQSEDVRYFSGLFNMRCAKGFSADVTHVIVNTNDVNNGAFKTLKYLQGVAYRKWVLSFNWIVDSVSRQELMNEEPYEVVDSTTLIHGPRNARLGEKGPFENFVFLCIEPFQNIALPDYEDLLRRTGATVVQSLSELAAEQSILKIIAIQAECHEKKIIEWYQITKAVPVAQEWVVECISQYRLVSFLPFLQELVPQDVLDIGFPEALIQDDEADFMYEIPD